jgi:hypothetical protein
LSAAKFLRAAQLELSEKRHPASTTICRDISGSLWFHYRSIDTDSRPCVSKMVRHVIDHCRVSAIGKAAMCPAF